MLKKLIFLLILFIAPLVSFNAHADLSGSGTCVSVSLNVNGGTTNGAPTPLYMKTGATTWYQDSSCTEKITKLESIATKSGSTFDGYYTATSGGTQCIDGSGNLLAACTFAAGSKNIIYAQYSTKAACYSVNLSLFDGSASATYYTNGTAWYSDAKCSSVLKKLTIPTRKSDGAMPVFFRTQCVSTETDYSRTGTVSFEDGGIGCSYDATSGLTCAFVASSITGNSYYCADTFASATNLTSMEYDGSRSVTLTYSATTSCYAITLNANGGTASTATLYKSSANTGWYTDAKCSATYDATTTNVIPTRSGYKFRGFFSTDLADVSGDASNGTIYIQNTGGSTLVGSSWKPTAATTIYAAWARNCTVPVNGSCTLSITSSTGAVDYVTSCNKNYTLGNGNTATPTCTSGFWNGGGGGSCGDVVNINFWGLNSNGLLENLTENAKPTFTNSSGQWKTSGGTAVTTFKLLGVSAPTISSSITVNGTTYAKGIKPYRAQWVGGTPTSIPDGMVAERTVCSSNMDESRDIALNGSLPNITDEIDNYATEANYIILYAANCIDPTGTTLGSTCSLSTANGGATYSNTCLPGTENPTFQDKTQTCLDYAVLEMEPGTCEL